MLQKCRDKDEVVRRAAYELLNQVRPCGCGKLACGACVPMRFGRWQFAHVVSAWIAQLLPIVHCCCGNGDPPASSLYHHMMTVQSIQSSSASNSFPSPYHISSLWMTWRGTCPSRTGGQCFKSDLNQAGLLRNRSGHQAVRFCYLRASWGTEAPC